MKTFYEGHDGVYKNRLAAGSRGWDTSTNGYEIHQSKLLKVLANGLAPTSSGKLLELGCGLRNRDILYQVSILPLQQYNWPKNEQRKPVRMLLFAQVM